MPSTILMPLPDRDFDVTEVAVPWHVLMQAGHQMVFATESGGRRPAADQRLLDGVIFGRLGAEPDAKALYSALLEDPAFSDPIPWSEVDPTSVDGLVLAGGHAPGMRQYLGSTELHEKVAALWATGMPVGAICHGVVVLARSMDPSTGRSVLEGHRTTALPKSMERSAFLATAWRLGRYYRTYPAYVQDEVTAAVGVDGEVLVGPRGLRRDTEATVGSGFVVSDGRYVSARWPGDAWTFAAAYADRLGT